MITISEKQFICDQADQLEEVAAHILTRFPEKRIFTFEGEMGFGKTTIIKSFCKVLGCSDTVTSPTFTIVNEYLSGNGEPIYHFDFYRAKSIEEIHDLGFEDYLYSGHYCFIEWPGKILPLLDGSELNIEITVREQTRIINLK